MTARAPLAALLLLAAPARADIGDAALKAAAAKLLEQGNQQFNHREYNAALTSFKNAYAKFPSPKIHLNIAFAQQKLGHLGAAAEAFDRFLEEGVYAAPTGALGDARQKLASLTPKVAQLHATGLTPAAKVEVDGAPVDVERALQHVYLDPGEHTAVATYDGKAVTRTVKIDAGATASIDLAPPVEAPPPIVISRPQERPIDELRETPKPLPGLRGRGLIIAGAVAAGVLVLGVAGTGGGVLYEHGRYVDNSLNVADRNHAMTVGGALSWTCDGLLIGAVAVALATAAYGLWAHYHPAE